MKGGWAMGHMRSHPPSHTITKRRMRCQPDRETLRAPIRSHLSHWMGWYVVADLCRTVLYDVNALLLQHAPNLLNIIHIHASNADAALELAVTVFNDFELKRDAVQPENDFSAQ